MYGVNECGLDVDLSLRAGNKMARSQPCSRAACSIEDGVNEVGSAMHGGANDDGGV